MKRVNSYNLFSVITRRFKECPLSADAKEGESGVAKRKIFVSFVRYSSVYDAVINMEESN